MVASTIFLDESGNTGSNYLDRQQPVYILGGWLIPQSRLGHVEERVAGVSTQAEELHGKRLMRQYKGQLVTSKLLLDLLALDCKPFYALAEKRYCVAAKMTETYLDPDYNSLAEDDMTWNTDRKQAYANRLYDLPSDILNRFAQAYRELDSAGLRQALDLTVAYLRRRGLRTLASRLMGARDRLEDIVEHEQEGYAIIGRGANTLNLPVFSSMINMVEGYARRHNVADVKIVHDEITQLEGTYTHTFQLYEGAPPKEIPLPNGASIYLGFERLRSFQTGRSVESKHLQTADLLCSALFLYCQACSADIVPSEPLTELATTLFPTLITNPNRQATFIGSEAFLERLLGPIARRLVTPIR